jgi:hypothetical protein
VLEQYDKELARSKSFGKKHEKLKGTNSQLIDVLNGHKGEADTLNKQIVLITAEYE